MTEERLQKFLARAGVASRRACEALIEEGLVKVNGRVVREHGTRVRAGEDIVEVNGRQINLDHRKVYLLLHKLPQTITSVFDPEGRRTVMEFVPPEFGRLFPVGRLDWDSEGAVLLTNDGELTQLLTHPKHEVTKTYQVKVKGILSPEDPRLMAIASGVRLDDGYKTKEASMSWDSTTGKHTWVVVGIQEGKNRQVRRMFDAVGLRVLRLRRISYGPVLMGELEPGDFRRLTEEEIDELYRAAGGKRRVIDASRGRLPDTKRESMAHVQKAARRVVASRYRARRDSRSADQAPREPAPAAYPAEAPSHAQAPDTRDPRRGTARRGEARSNARQAPGEQRAERRGRGEAPRPRASSERGDRAATQGERSEARREAPRARTNGDQTTTTDRRGPRTGGEQGEEGRRRDAHAPAQRSTRRPEDRTDGPRPNERGRAPSGRTGGAGPARASEGAQGTKPPARSRQPASKGEAPRTDRARPPRKDAAGGRDTKRRR